MLFKTEPRSEIDTVRHIIFYQRYPYNPYVSRKPLNSNKNFAEEISPVWSRRVT